MSLNREKGKEAFENKNYKKAIDYFTLSLRDYPLKDLEILYSNRSASYLEMGEYESALKDAQSAIIHAPDWSKGYYRKAEALMKLKRFKEAKAAYLESLRLVCFPFNLEYQ